MNQFFEIRVTLVTIYDEKVVTVYRADGVGMAKARALMLSYMKEGKKFTVDYQ